MNNTMVREVEAGNVGGWPVRREVGAADRDEEANGVTEPRARCAARSESQEEWAPDPTSP